MATGPGAGDRTGSGNWTESGDQPAGRHPTAGDQPTGAGAATPGGRTAARQAAVATAYRQELAGVGGVWRACVSVQDSAGTARIAVAHGADEPVEAYSVNKIAVAVAVLDKIDRGLLRLDQPMRVTAAALVPDGDGIFGLVGAYPNSVTLGHVLAALLTVSDDTAVRLCGLVCPARELNAILAAKGFPGTRVEPVADPNRFYLGTTTARETHDLLRALVRGQLLGSRSTAFLLAALRAPIAFTDGIRRRLSDDERRRVATKAGWFEDARGEAGVIFDSSGTPALTYAMFAHAADPAGGPAPEAARSVIRDASHPAVRARAAMGRRFLDALDGADPLDGPHPPPNDLP